MSAERVTSLYVHVPFCAQKCSYCAFYSEASSGELIQRYVNALVRELEIVASDLAPRTIFFGGGTPSILNLRQWEQILGAMDRLGLGGAAEWTVECNPATVSLDKAKLLRSHGVNRISMGVQSLDADLLEKLGRVHSREMVFKSFEILRAAGFDNVNVDLMFAIPGQTTDIWKSTLDEALALGSEHLSSYEVIYEEDTPLFQQLKAGEFDVNEDLACEMYEELRERSAASGFQQYEIANFARNHRVSGAGDPEVASSSVLTCSRTMNSMELELRTPSPQPSPPGRGRTFGRLPEITKPPCQSSPCSSKEGDAGIPAFACRHNVNYWRGGPYYGLGPSAAGYVRGVRTRNWANTQLYCEQLEKGARAIESREELPPERRAGELAAFGLRMNSGWPFEDFRRLTGRDMRTEWPGEMEQLVRRGWGHADAQRFQLTAQGLRFADAAAEMFLR